MPFTIVLMNSLEANICFSENGDDTFVKKLNSSDEFVQISPTCVPNTCQIIERFYTSSVSISNGSIKNPIGK